MVNRAEESELRIFVQSNASLKRQQYEPIVKNLATKKARGVYQHALAVKLFRYMVDNADKMYFSGTTEMYRVPKGQHVTTSTETRNAVADALARGFEQEWDAGNYRSLLPKKYQKTNPARRSRLGSGGRFRSCVRKVAARGGAYDPRAVCAAAGTRKYGKRRMAKWAAAGRRRAGARNPAWSFTSQGDAERFLSQVERNGGKGAITQQGNQWVVVWKSGKRRRNPERWTMAAIRAANRDKGLYFFSRDTLKFFNSKIYPTVYQGVGGVFFVTSERPPDGDRTYSVRKFDENTARITKVGTFINLHSAQSAASMARR